MATHTLISSNILNTAASSVTFSSIPQNYTDLVLKWSARGSNSAQLKDVMNITLNSDGSLIYSSTLFQSSGSSVYNATKTNDGPMVLDGFSAGSSATGSVFANSEIYFSNYTSTSNKAYLGFAAVESDSLNAYLSTLAGLYRNSTAITSIQLTPGNSTNFVSGSSFYLYGIKNS